MSPTFQTGAVLVSSQLGDYVSLINLNLVAKGFGRGRKRGQHPNEKGSHHL